MGRASGAENSDSLPQRKDAANRFPVTVELRQLPLGTLVSRQKVRAAAKEQNAWDFEASDSTLGSRIWRFPRYLRAETPLEQLRVFYRVVSTKRDRYVNLLEQGKRMPPVVCNLMIKEIIDGNHRFKAAEQAELLSVPSLIGLPSEDEWERLVGYDSPDVAALLEGIKQSLPEDVLANLAAGELAYLFAGAARL